MTALGLFERVQAAAGLVRPLLPWTPEVGVVLGSGLAQIAQAMAAPVRLPYRDIPHLAPTGVDGHRGELLLGTLGGARVLLFCGRAHAYEGHGPAEVGLGVRLLAALGAHTLVLTNAAGGIGPRMRPGDLMAIVDHINLTGQNPLVGPNDPRLGPRFPDLTRAWSPVLVNGWRQAALQASLPLHEGVYAGVLGPNYETPSEVQLLARMGAHAVGMSTVHEALVARHAGLRLAGLSVITNCAAGLGDGDLSHAEVTAAGQAAQSRVLTLLEHFLAAARQPPGAGPEPPSGA